jgi:hypothetical protein
VLLKLNQSKKVLLKLIIIFIKAEEYDATELMK